MLRIVDAVCAILAPDRHLLGTSLRASEQADAEKFARNAALTMEAMKLAKMGHRVQLKLTNSSWIEFTSEPAQRPEFNGKTIDAAT